MVEREKREERDREKRDKRELSLQFEEEDKEHRHLPLLVVQLPQGTEFPTRFCRSAAALNLKVIVSSSRLGKGSGLKRLLKY